METLARAEAVAAGRAVPIATVRHRHLSARPLVLVLLTTAGEVGAPLGALVGTDRAAPRLLTVPQPRDRDLRFAFLAELAAEVLPYVESYADATEAEPPRRGDDGPPPEVAVDAPQLVVPNGATVAYLRLLGRATRFRRTAEQHPDEPHPVPPRVPLLGRWLTHYGERARVPGQSLLLAATEVLTRHWATGQSAMEDGHLGALLAWLDPPDGVDGAAAAHAAETGRGPDGLLRCPPAGPATDPVFDNRALAPAIARWDRAAASAAAAPASTAARDELGKAVREIDALVESQLRPGWDAVWRGLDLLAALPEGAHVPERWKRDRWSYTSHLERLRAGEPPQPRHDDAVSAARKLASRETAQVRLAAQEALDDPLVMAGRRLAGEAFAGEVTEVEMAWTEAKVPRPRPLVHVRTEDAPLLDVGARVWRALPEGRAQQGEHVGPGEAGVIIVRLLDGMGRGREPSPGSVPAKGDAVCWTLFEHAPRGGPALPEPEDTPWTHGGPPGEAATIAERPDALTAEDYL
jgi:hypothetical protein